MATRRAAPGRSRSSSMQPPAAPPPAPRARSALARPKESAAAAIAARTALTTPVDDNHDAETFPVPQLRQSKASGSQSTNEDNEINIRVVLRCRRRSEREIQENSPIIVQTQGAKGQDLTIETAIPTSNFGVVTLPPTRTYPFDMVFGPEADQALIYHEVVNPMLEEVTQGYNCTLFAYGQTGTGKTYTMQGDLAPTAMGNPSPHAGMIPRVLFRLFHQLETSGADYSVKISFVELYNEELRDLLASDLAAPSGSAQPMGMGGSKDTAGQLKLFDDASKKGVFIQGLEECPVKDTTDALALLTKGSHRRQIAATKFNDHSSRSHSIFSITVHIKETSNIGDDLLKVGKLNLVDLAGSENIGRSGAENKRAREAGMINQSLLTLGRVINALVDRSSHVPYRESKLTRLLQDSLGGRTKTCLIATISPARFNMEETLSTLDYALRAKSIRNKPEVNQRMSRNALLKEYVGEIERLKADVLAAREKNGIFFSEETWNQMTAEQELKDTEMQEAKKQVEMVESQLRNVREEFEQSIALLMKRDGELKETKEKLFEKETALQIKQSQLKVTKVALEEETVVRKAYQENETVLDGVASGLKQVANQSVQDLGRLFGKLDRRNAAYNANTKAVTTHVQTLNAETRTFSSKLDDFVKLSNQHISQLKSESEQYQTKEIEALNGFSARVTEQLEKMRDALKVIHAKDEATDVAANDIQTAVDETQEMVKTSFSKWANELRVFCETTSKKAETTSVATFASAEKTFKAIGSIAELLLQEAQDYVLAERKSLLEAKALADNTSQGEILRLQQQNALLTRLLESEKAKSERAKDELIKRISGLLGDFTAERDRSLREAFSEMSDSNAAAEKGMVKLGEQQGQQLESVIANGTEWAASLEKRRGDLKRNRDGGLKHITLLSTVGVESVKEVQDAVSTATTSYTTDISRQMQHTGATFTQGLERMSRAKRARIDTTESMFAEAQSGYRFMQRSLASTSRNVESFAGRVTSETAGLSNSLDLYRGTSNSHLTSLRQSSQNLADNGTKADTPTGTTPRKRSWDISDRWDLTKGRDVILKDWRQRGQSAAGNETFLAEHLPLPDGAETDNEGMQNQPTTSSSFVSSKMAQAGIKTVILLSFVLAVGFLMIILSCALWSNWLPLLVALTFVLAPLPNAIFAHCGGDDFSTDYEGSGPVDLGRFITSTVVVTGFALPLVLAHSEIIKPGACAMSIVGGGLVYGTILAYSAAFRQEESDYD
ncbi:kinesin motor protein cin8 [Steccherinum ochraceum]|uniref:Kinesin motor protein cin8 n=1 Tax=Steccherinum ochraceum TaxID=92696 RepID=A0A4R0RVW1_9APHY|nr:kinesin motor protein cin8 [Steccherinum ochraceum]